MSGLYGLLIIWGPLLGDVKESLFPLFHGRHWAFPKPLSLPWTALPPGNAQRPPVMWLPCREPKELNAKIDLIAATSS
eukprot:1045698-Amphidinium_carterae.1